MGNYFNKYFINKETNIKPLKRKNTKSISKEKQELKRFRSTFDYLYQKLFIEGEGSDISINAFNKSWKLHKLYINQSPFFASMFSGGWLENNSSEVNLEFSDPNITSESLEIIFASFYYDSLKLKENNVVPVLAASIWFQLKDLRVLCEDFLLNTLKLENIIHFYEIAQFYEISRLTNQCIEWLCNTILLIDDCELFFSLLQSISPNLMLKIIKSPKLFVIQIEQDVFLLLLKWLYLKIRPERDPSSPKDINTVVYNYFKFQDLKLSDFPELCGLYNELFEAIRWEQIMSTFNAASTFSKFTIIPQSTLMSVYKTQWLLMLKSNECKTSNLSKNSNLELFWNKSERCGRKLLTDSNTTWRWNTYKYGIDIVIRYINREFYIIRYIDRQNCPDWMKHVPEKRPLQLHLTVSTYYLQKCGENAFYPIFTNRLESGVLTLELLENFPVKVLSVPKKFEFPLLLSANFLRYDPNEINLIDDSCSSVQSNQSLSSRIDYIYPI